MHYWFWKKAHVWFTKVLNTDRLTRVRSETDLHFANLLPWCSVSLGEPHPRWVRNMDLHSFGSGSNSKVWVVETRWKHNVGMWLLEKSILNKTLPRQFLPLDYHKALPVSWAEDRGKAWHSSCQARSAPPACSSTKVEPLIFVVFSFTQSILLAK